MFRALLYFFLIYMAYQFIFKFLIPVYRTTRQIKKGVRDMSARMNQSDGYDRTNEFSNSQHSSTTQTNPSHKSSKKPIGDYIDFEEVK